MNHLAIQPTPSPTSTSADAGSTSTASGHGFGDTLRQTTAQSKPHDNKPAHADKQAAPKHDSHKTDTKTGTDPKHKDDKDSQDGKHKDKTAQPATPVAVPLAPATQRQPAAASGKALPATATAAAAAVANTTAATKTTAPVVADPAANDAKTQTPDVPAAKTAKDQAAATKAASDAKLTAGTQKPGDDNKQAAPADKHAAPSTQSANNAFATQLSHLAGNQQAAANQIQAPPAQLNMQASPGQPQFAQETAQHVAWMAGQNIQQARIQMNPGNLGPIHVQVTTHHDHVDVSFAVQNPQTVNALQQTLPQLHDMLAQQGLNLGQASVGQQAPNHQQAAPFQYMGHDGRVGDSGSSEVDLSPTWRSARIAGPGRVDDFA